MNANIEKIFKSVESAEKAYRSDVIASYRDHRKNVAIAEEEAAIYKDEERELARRKATSIDFNRQRIAAANKRFADTARVAVAQARKEMARNLVRPANPELLDALRTYAEFGLKMTREELESYLALAGDNNLALKAVKAVAERSGFTVTLPDDGFEADLKTIESMTRVPNMWCDPDYLAEALEVLPDKPIYREDGSVSHTVGRPDSVYLLTRSGMHNSAVKELERISQKWGTRFVPEISELKPVEDPETGETISPEQQHASAVAAVVDSVDIKQTINEMKADTSGRDVLAHYL